MNIESIALIIGIVSLLMNVGIIVAAIFYIKNLSDKLSLLSHVAGHYLNTMEKKEAEKSLNAATIGKALLKRGAR